MGAPSREHAVSKERWRAYLDEDSKHIADEEWP